jgi:hypothetical protein
MGPGDIIGKEFTCFKFEPIDNLILWDVRYQRLIGRTAIVTEIDSSHPQYAYVKVISPVGENEHVHYPTQMIIDKSIEELLNEMKQLTSQLWKQKI